MFERTPNVWEVTLQKPDGTTSIEKVRSFWDPEFAGTKADIATAGRCKAVIRNKGKVDFKNVNTEPVLVGKADAPGGVTA